MSFGFLKAVPFVGSFYNTLAYRALVYGYSNARIKSMKSVLLDKKFFQDVLSASSISEIVSLLEKTSYKEDLAAASLEKISNEIDLIEFALAKNLNRTVSSLAKISPQEALPFLNTVFERYDVHNLKTVLLAKHLKQTPESAKKLLLKPVNVSEYKLNELLESGNVFEAVEKLRQTEYYNSLADALPEYKEKSEVVPLLQALDLFYFEKIAQNLSTAKKGDAAIVSKLLESDIDSKNLMNILRAKKSNAENLFIEKILISNGGMDKKYLSGLLKLESVEKIIETVKAKFGLQQALEKFKEDNSLIHFELGLEKLKLSKGLSVLRRSILSIGTIMGFVYLKEQEISNIKKILRAKEFNIEKEETEKMLLFI